MQQLNIFSPQLLQALLAKEIASKFSKELGFINRATLIVAESKKELEVIPGIGFANFHHRKDGQTTIYEIAVAKEYQRQGWGRLLFYRILCSAIEKGCSKIVLKCPTELPANAFYSKLGFILEEVEPGKKRPLNRWVYKIQLPLLFYCGDAGGSKYDDCAVDAGWRAGLRSDKRAGKSCKIHCQMIDNHWVGYHHAEHLAQVKHHKPLIATARDVESPEQLPEILEQAAEIAQYCGRVLIVPKIAAAIPEEYWLAYSVPTKYGATSVNLSVFKNRFIHLLGGSPKSQASLAGSPLLNVISLDGNYAMNIARFGKSAWQGFEGKAEKGCYPSLALSLKKQKEYWHREWCWQDEPLFKESKCNN